MSIARWAAGPATAKDLPVLDLQNARCGSVVSVKLAIEMIRRDAPHLKDTDEELTRCIVEVATGFGLFVAFDSRE
jgi:hypothetical protein